MHLSKFSSLHPRLWPCLRCPPTCVGPFHPKAPCRYGPCGCGGRYWLQVPQLEITDTAVEGIVQPTADCAPALAVAAGQFSSVGPPVMSHLEKNSMRTILQQGFCGGFHDSLPHVSCGVTLYDATS